MTKYKQVVFLSGAAATGKTSIINALMLKRPDAALQPSITRGFYAQRGIKNEIEFQVLSAEDKKDFQLAALYYYCETTLDFVRKNLAETDLIIIDRAPLDHLAWCLYNVPNLTMDEYKQAELLIHNFCTSVAEIAESTLVVTPFPCHWTKNGNQSSDGFRYDVFGKNLVLNHLITGLVTDYEPYFSNSFVSLDTISGISGINRVHNLTPEQRADHILNQLESFAL